MGTCLKDKVCSIMSQTDIAKKLGTAPQSVSLWLNGEVPAHRVIPFCEALRWEITPYEIRNDIYPNPTDGLRGQQEA